MHATTTPTYLLCLLVRSDYDRRDDRRDRYDDRRDDRRERDYDRRERR